MIRLGCVAAKQAVLTELPQFAFLGDRGTSQVEGGFRIELVVVALRGLSVEHAADQVPDFLGVKTRESDVEVGEALELLQQAGQLGLVLEVARAKPGRRKQRAYLAKHKPDLMAQLAQQGLLDGFVGDWGCVSEADEEARAESSGLELPF